MNDGKNPNFNFWVIKLFLDIEETQSSEVEDDSIQSE